LSPGELPGNELSLGVLSVEEASPGEPSLGKPPLGERSLEGLLKERPEEWEPFVIIEGYRSA